MSEELNVDTMGEVISGGTDNLQGWIFAGQSAHGLVTTHRSIVGEIASATESQVQQAMPSSGRVKALRVNVPIHTSATATTVEFRRNGVAVLTVVIPALATGVFEIIATVELLKDDLINYRIVSGGASIVIIPQCQLEIDTI